MSIICKNCNAVLDDDSKFCTQCGSTELVINEAPKKSNKKLFAIIGGAVAVVLVAVLLLVFVGGKSYQSVLDDYAELLSGNVEKIEELEKFAPIAIWDFYEKEEGESIDEIKAELKEDIKEDFPDVKERFGADYKCSLEVLREEEVSENDLYRIADYVEETYELDGDLVEKAYNITVKQTREGSEYISVSSGELAVLKVDGEWYLVALRENNDGQYQVKFFVDSMF